jgi:hypothetical protein
MPMGSSPEPCGNEALAFIAAVALMVAALALVAAG